MTPLTAGVRWSIPTHGLDPQLAVRMSLTGDDFLFAVLVIAVLVAVAFVVGFIAGARTARRRNPR